MAKIDILKHKLRYNKDFSYQLTGKDLKILLDYLGDLEETITTTIESAIITQTFTIMSDDIATAPIGGYLIPITDASQFIILGGSMICPTGAFTSNGESLYITATGNGILPYLEFKDGYLNIPTSTYYGQNFCGQPATSAYIYSSGFIGVPVTNEPVYLTLTYLKIA